MSNGSDTARFQPGVPSNALTSLIAKGVRQHLKAKGVEIKHTEVLNAIAQALGLDSANALRALAETGEHPRGSIPAKHAHYYRTRYVLDVLAEETPLTTRDITQIDYETDEGSCVGHIQAVQVTPLTAQEMHEALLAAGNSGDFFEDLADKIDGSAAGRLLNTLRRLAETPAPISDAEASQALAAAEHALALTAENPGWLRQILSERVALITKRPGDPEVPIALIAHAIWSAREKPALAAPTAKGVNALADRTGLPATTLIPLRDQRAQHGSITRQTLIVNDAHLADPNDLLAIAQGLDETQSLILIGDPSARPANEPSPIAALSQRPDVIAVYDAGSQAGAGTQPLPEQAPEDSHHSVNETPGLSDASRAVLRLACQVDSSLRIRGRPNWQADLGNAIQLAREIARHGGLDPIPNTMHGERRHLSYLVERCDPTGALRVADPATLPDNLVQMNDRLFATETPAANILAWMQPGLTQILKDHGPRHVGPPIIPLLTRLLAQEMRNAVNAGDTPALQEAADAVRQGGETLWADIDPGVEMVRYDADAMIAVMKTLEDRIGREADLEQLLIAEGIKNPWTHRSARTRPEHRPDGDRPVIEGRAPYIAAVTYAPPTRTGTRTRTGETTGEVTCRLLVLAPNPEAAERTAGALLAGHPDVGDQDRVNGIAVTRNDRVADRPAEHASPALRRICRHLAREADYALTLGRVLRFVQTPGAPALTPIVGNAPGLWSRDMLVAEIAGFAASAKNGWSNEQVVADLA